VLTLVIWMDVGVYGENSEMRKIILAVLLGGTALAQTHTYPAPQQCVSDVTAWYYQWRLQATFKSDDPGPPFMELQRREDEMADCGIIKAPNGPIPYEEMTALYWNEQNERQKSFLTRHGLMKQFLKEDDAGGR
jgi:hypothetical protein